MKKGQASRTAEYWPSFAPWRGRARPTGASWKTDSLQLSSRLDSASSSAYPGCLWPAASYRTYIDRRWPGARTSAVARTRFIDDAAEEARGSAVE